MENRVSREKQQSDAIGTFPHSGGDGVTAKAGDRLSVVQTEATGKRTQGTEVETGNGRVKPGESGGGDTA